MKGTVARIASELIIHSSVQSSLHGNITPEAEQVLVQVASLRAAAHPFSISVDKNATYPEAFSTSQVERVVPKDCKLRREKYLNNVIEQDHTKKA
jgi:transposase-like protein